MHMCGDVSEQSGSCVLQYAGFMHTNADVSVQGQDAGYSLLS